MIKVIIYRDEYLKNYYERTMDYLHDKYHSNPSSLPSYPLDAEVIGEMEYYQCLANNSFDEDNLDSTTPIGKQVW